MEYILDEKGYKLHHNSMPIKYIINNNCWECISHKLSNAGYPLLSRYGKAINGHRYSYMLHKGEIPKGMVVMHTCDNTSCINPEHLILGTHSDNMKDMYKKGRGSTTKQEMKEQISKKVSKAKRKLNDVQIIEIKQMLDNKIPINIIAKNFNISRITIYRIKSGKSVYDKEE